MTYRDFIEAEAIRIARSTGGDVFPDVEFNIPTEHREEAAALLRDAAARDEACPNGDPMAPFGKWHRAANAVQGEMRNAGVPYLGTWSHRALMRVAASIKE